MPPPAAEIHRDPALLAPLRRCERCHALHEVIAAEFDREARALHPCGIDQVRSRGGRDGEA